MSEFHYHSIGIYIDKKGLELIQIDRDLDIFILFRGCSYGGERARLGGLAHLGEMIFIPRSYGIFCVSSTKRFLRPVKRMFDQVVFTINSDVKPSCRTNVLILFN